jgi:MFS superfamily sulfate permease-like transporter
MDKHHMTAATRAARDAKFTSIVGWSSNYQIDWLRFNLIAGLTVAAVAILQAMAYATIAGLPVEAVMYVALVPMLVYALLGMSRPLSVGVTSTITMPSTSALASAAPDGDGSLGKPG